MKSPMEMLYQTGNTLFVVSHNPDGTVWNAVSKVWEEFNAGQWANYAIPMTEQGASGYYSGEYPEEIGDDVLTTEVIYLQAGVAPAVDDTGLSMGQTQGSNVAAIRYDCVAAENLRTSAKAMAKGTAAAGTLSATQMSTNLTSALVGAFVSRVIVFTSGNLKDQVANIVAYDGAGLLTFGNVTEAPAEGDTFVIV